MTKRPQAGERRMAWFFVQQIAFFVFRFGLLSGVIFILAWIVAAPLWITNMAATGLIGSFGVWFILVIVGTQLKESKSRS